MSYKTKWYNEKECNRIAEQLSDDTARITGEYVQDHGATGLPLGGATGRNIEIKLMAGGAWARPTIVSILEAIAYESGEYNITLSTGTVIVHKAMSNGAQDALVLGREGEAMTEQEWQEYCQIIRTGGYSNDGNDK